MNSPLKTAAEVISLGWHLGWFSALSSIRLNLGRAIALRLAGPASSLPLREPGSEVLGPLEIKQCLGQGFQFCQG